MDENDVDGIMDGLGVEINLKSKEDFLKVKETLTRLGVSSKTEKRLFQSCHILHKRGRYYLMHFKEMFLLDGLKSDISDDDIGRRNTIVKLLVEWNLVTAVNTEDYKEPQLSLARLKIIPHSQKRDWELIAKYTMGR
jgi:hypothetical protein